MNDRELSSVSDELLLLRICNDDDRKAFAVHLDPVNMVTSPALFFRNGEMIKDCFKKLGPYIKSCHAKDLILKKQTFFI